MNTTKIAKDFPILKRKINGKRIVYLDNVATTQKPQQVIDAESDYYKKTNANIHRGLYTLSVESAALYEHSKKVVADFIGASSFEEIIYTKNTTESINLVAHSLFRSGMIKKGDTILLTRMEHHSNLVPWQYLAKLYGARIEYIELNSTETELDYADAEKKIKQLEPKVVALTHASNVLGTINDVARISIAAHIVGALVVVDAAQSAPHIPIDVCALGADFLAFSGHKMLAPMGIGVLYGQKDILEKMEPFMVGGDMISTVTYTDATWNALPYKFEAGTPNVAGAIALAAAITYLKKIGMKKIHAHGQALAKRAMTGLQKMGATVYGPTHNKRTGLVSFNLKGIHPHDVGSLLDKDGIAIRTGNHCAQPLMELLGMQGSCRVGFYVYNTTEDVDALLAALKKVQKVFS